MSTKSQQRLSASSLVILAIGFVVAVAISNALFSGWRIDLTEDRLYTLSDGTRNMLGKIEEPINLYFYYSDQVTRDVPSIRRYAERVQELLEEFEDAANGNLRLSVIDPLPFSEDEDRATGFGLQGVSLGIAPDPIYFGLAGTDSLDNEEIIPFFQPDKEAFLEYDIAKLVSALANPDRTIIGVVSPLEMAGTFNPQMQGMSRPWVVYQQIEQLFEVRNLGMTFSEIADDISILMIVQPRGLGNDARYAIDQFVMGGGKAIIFVDPLANIDAASPEGMPQGMPPMGQGSDLPELFAAWGIAFDSQQVVADAQLALQISGMNQRPMRHYGYLGINDSRMSSDDIVTADLDVINVATAGAIAAADDRDIEFQPLLWSSEASQGMPVARFSFLPDPSTLQADFVPGGEAMVVAARVSGTLPSAFPDGPPPDSVSTAPEDANAAVPDDHLTASSAPANLIIVADVDLLGDQMWVQVQSFFGQQIANAFASNGSFVVNALENLAGSSDLIGVRSRASYTRPFTRVDAIRADAEAEYRATERRLQDELAETERRLRELQESRDDAGTLLLSDEQQGEIDRFIEQRASIRQELRAVQRGLDADIERLGTTLKIINIALVPVLLTTFTLIVVWRRSRRDDA